MLAAMRDGGVATAELKGLLRQAFKFSVSFGGQRSIQLSYGCFGGSFSRLAWPRQRPCGGWEGVGARPRRRRSHVRIVSGAPEKGLPGVPGLWRVDLSW